MHALNLVHKMLSQQNFRGLKEEGSKPDKTFVLFFNLISILSVE